MNIFLEQLLICRVKLGVRIGVVDIAVYQIDADAKIVLSQDFIFVVPLQRRWVVLDKPIVFKRIHEELQIKRDIGETVAVFDAHH